MIDLIRLRLTDISRCLTLASAAIVLLSLPGCSGIEKAPPQPSSKHTDKGFTLDTPEIMRGTVSSECVLRGYQAQSSPGYRPVVARGYGLVVGLKGTGARDIPPQLREYMLQEAAKGGFGGEKFGEQIAAITPEQLLDSPDTAVVIVEAVVPQGAPAGTHFDVRVYAQPASGTTSLEGGTLYSTLLRPGAPAMGGKQAAELAKAHGPIFVNPFVEGGIGASDSVQATAGRVLNGGEVLKDMPLKLVLANPSHARAQVLVMAVNTRFPEEPGMRQATARGENDQSIEITVPPSFYGRTEEFVKLLLYTTIAQSNPEAAAMFVKRTMLANPGPTSDDASLRWQALGIRVLPIIKDLYDHPEERPRMAALRAGAKLDDGLVIPHLIEMAEQSSSLNRMQAIELLEGMRSNPRIDVCLRKLLNDNDVEIRLRAYEALVMRNDPFMDRVNVDGKFVLDVVPSDKPLIYVTQVRQPRIAVFDNTMALGLPLTLSAWSNRLMIKGDLGEPEVEVYYRDPSQNQGIILHTKPQVQDFVRFLGHKTSVEAPAPGLNLTYSETVGALQEIWRQRHINADFKLEQDRILALIRRVQTENEVEERPELSANPDEAPAMQPASDLGRLGEAPVVLPSMPQAQPPANKPGG